MSLKLSEAIRLGAMVTPQCTRRFYHDGATCAFGSALHAVGALNRENPMDSEQNQFIYQRWPLTEQRAACPVCGMVAKMFIVGAFCLNDTHHWTREQIADWVETLEPKDAPVEQPAADEVMR